MTWIRKIVPEATLFDTIYLQLEAGNLEFPVIWITVKAIHLIWKNRETGGLSPLHLLAELKGEIHILKGSKRFGSIATVIEAIIGT